MRKFLAPLLAALLLPACAGASGFLRTVSEPIPQEEQQELTPSDYTGDVRITFLGDCTLGGESPVRYPSLSFEQRIRDNGMDFPFRELRQLTEGDDLTVANLEGVLTDRSLQKADRLYRDPDSRFSRMRDPGQQPFPRLRQRRLQRHESRPGRRGNLLV